MDTVLSRTQDGLHSEMNARHQATKFNSKFSWNYTFSAITRAIGGEMLRHSFSKQVPSCPEQL